MVTAVFAAVTSKSCPFEPVSPTQVFALAVPGTDAPLCGAGARPCALSEGEAPQCDLCFPTSAGTHPSPRCCRAEDLEHIHNQLRTIKVRGLARLLDKLQSSYFPAFQAMCRDVAAGDDRKYGVPSPSWCRIAFSLCDFPVFKTLQPGTGSGSVTMPSLEAGKQLPCALFASPMLCDLGKVT